MSPEDIDYIFKKGTNQQKFPFKESDWDSMEARLDKQDRKRLFARYALLSLLFITIASIGGIYLQNTNVNSTDSIKGINKEPVFKSNIENTKDTKRVIASSSKKSNTLNTDSKLLKPLDKNNLLTKSSDNLELTSSNQNQNRVTFNHINPDQKINVYNPQPAFNAMGIKNKLDNKTSHKIPSYAQSINTTNNEESKLENSNAINTIPNISLLPSNPITYLAFDENPIESKVYKFRKPKNNRFAFSIVAGKEWSGVGNMTDAKEGFRLGAEIAYQFGNKFQIGTGFIFSKKHYETVGTNYTPQPQFRWVDGNAPETVNGTCDVFEIPLELTYFFKGNDKNTFYASAGLSTYIMNNEWYDFRWEDQAIMADPTVPKSSSNQALDRKCIHWFGIGNLSFGYKKYLSKNIAAQLGTYVQVPITGIGMGNVDLFSTGVQMKISFAK